MAKSKQAQSKDSKDTSGKTVAENKPRVKIDKTPDNTISISISVPWNEVEEVRKQVVARLIQNIELPGFRKGKAPREIAEGKLSKDAVREEMLKVILTDEYSKAVKDNNIRPIINPKIHIEAFEEGTNLEFTASTCEEPKTELKNYKDEVKKLTAGSKIIVPGKPEEKVSLDKILAEVLKNATVIVPKILIEEEANRLLSQLLDELKRLGVSLDQYLKSRDRSAEDLRAEYEEKAQNDIKLEFVLRKVADDEKITVEKEDLEKAITAIKDEKERQEIAKNPYLVASIIRQQKTLDFLSKL